MTLAATVAWMDRPPTKRKKVFIAAGASIAVIAMTGSASANQWSTVGAASRVAHVVRDTVRPPADPKAETDLPNAAEPDPAPAPERGTDTDHTVPGSNGVDPTSSDPSAPVAADTARTAAPQAPKNVDKGGASAVLQGTLHSAHGDPLEAFDGQSSQHTGVLEELTMLQTDDGLYEITGLSHDQAHQLSGKKVKVRAEPRSGKLALVNGIDDVEVTAEPAVVAEADMAAAGVETRKVAVILLNFSNDTRKPFSVDQIRSTMFTGTTSVAQLFRESSYNRLEVTGDVFGWYTVPETSAGCNLGPWTASAREAATASGVNLADYKYFMYMFPSTSCGWAGVAWVNGTESWINGTSSAKVMAHELGHNFGYLHASSLRCKNAAGTTVPLSDSCGASEYGDPFDTMGASYRTFNGRFRQRTGWVPDTQTVSASGTYTVRALNGSDGPRQLRIFRDDGTSFFIEARRAAGTFDKFTIANGAHVRIGRDNNGSHTRLLDGTPETSGFDDAAFTPGRSFTDPLSGVTVAVTAATTTDTTVSVTFPNPTSGNDTAAPTTPPGLKGTMYLNMAGARVTLNWAASTDNVGVVGYRIFRNGQRIATTTALSFRDDNEQQYLPWNTRYTYTVVAFDAAGNTSQAATVTVTTPDVDNDTTAPTAPGNLTGTATLTVTGAAVDLAWTASTDNIGVSGYRISRNSTVLGSVSSGARKFTDPTAAAATKYTYTVVALDYSGNVSPAASVTIATPTTGDSDTSAPTAPTNLKATAALTSTASSVSLTWSASSDNVGVAGYRVARNTTVLGTTTALGFNDSNAARGTIYSYTVVAFDVAGNISPSASVTVSTPIATATTPVVAGPAAGQMKVSWDAVSGATGYDLWFAGKTTAGTPIAATTSFKLTTTNRTFLGLPGGSYTVKVRARVNDTLGAWSPTASTTVPAIAATTLTAPAAPTGTSPAAGSAAVSWGAMANVSRYDLVYTGTTATGSTISLLVPSIWATSRTITGLPAGTYTFRVRSVSNDAISPWSWGRTVNVA
jgi:chitodextrinase